MNNISFGDKISKNLYNFFQEGLFYYDYRSFFNTSLWIPFYDIFAVHLFPILGTVFYIETSHVLKTVSFDSKRLNTPVYYFSLVHNLGLAGFSFFTFRELCAIIWTQGITAGHTIYMSQPYVKSLIFWFYISKYYEYFDTFLLYVKGRDPIFLQKYHHIGAVICWHLCYVYNVDMIVFGTILNSGVHTIMYSYYFSTLLKLNIRAMRMYITSLQIVQLLTGVITGSYYYMPPIETYWNYYIIMIFNAYVAGLLYLFGKFMVENYFSTKVT
jgi:hypothetical protein